MEAVCSMGSALEDPFITLSFRALPTIPEIKLTDLDLLNVIARDRVDPFVAPGETASVTLF